MTHAVSEDEFSERIAQYNRENPRTGNGAIPNSSALKPRIRLIPFDEIKLGTEPRYLVKGIIPRQGLAVVWGPPKCGKSFWIFDLAMHVALGWQYRERRVQQGAVVYCAFEGQTGIQARVEAFRQTFPIETDEPVQF